MKQKSEAWTRTAALQAMLLLSIWSPHLSVTSAPHSRRSDAFVFTSEVSALSFCTDQTVGQQSSVRNDCPSRHLSGRVIRRSPWEAFAIDTTPPKHA